MAILPVLLTNFGVLTFTMKYSTCSKPPAYHAVMAASNQQNTLPSRTHTSASEEEAVPEGDPSSTSGILIERLQAWKHMVSYLEDYVKTVGKGQHSEAKEHEKILKVLASNIPFRCSTRER